MTQEEQQQVSAAMQFLERQVANVTREGANATMMLEAVAQKCKALEAELAALKEPKTGEQQSNVTPIGKKTRKPRKPVQQPESAGESA